jgi:hypothetical protein
LLFETLEALDALLQSGDDIVDRSAAVHHALAFDLDCTRKFAVDIQSPIFIALLQVRVQLGHTDYFVRGELRRKGVLGGHFANDTGVSVSVGSLLGAIPDLPRSSYISLTCLTKNNTVQDMSLAIEQLESTGA